MCSELSRKLAILLVRLLVSYLASEISLLVRYLPPTPSLRSEQLGVAKLSSASLKEIKTTGQVSSAPTYPLTYTELQEQILKSYQPASTKNDTINAALGDVVVTTRLSRADLYRTVIN